MLDLFLTDSGDLSFLTNISSKMSEGFEFNFHVAQSDSLLFNFYIDNIKMKENDNSFKYNFYTYTPSYNKEIMTVSSKNSSAAPIILLQIRLSHLRMTAGIIPIHLRLSLKSKS